MHHKVILACLLSAGFATAALTPATAADAAAPASRVKISGHVEAGITANPDDPNDRQNFGRLFDDRANEPMLNQFLLTAEQALDPKAPGFDWGFKLQGMVGSDARFTHSTGLLDHSGRQIIQPDLVEAYLNTHFAVNGTAGGVDVKFGKFATLEGAEVIDSTGNVFYSHSYMFNFGVPLVHTGALATIHATKDVDIMAGITQGVNTFKDNNGKLAFHGGIGLPNLVGGKASLVVSTHFGPETPHDNKNYRWLNDAVFTYKVDDKLTAITDINYIQDDGPKPHAKGYGVAQYFTYAVDKMWQANFRAEVWRDNNGFFVAQIGNNTDLLRFERGDTFTPDARTVGGGVTTYGAITVGATWKASDAIVIRPELRYDRSLNDTKPFNDSKHKDMFTAAVDVTWSF